MVELPLACPSCGRTLKAGSDGAACASPKGCGASFPRREGILSFSDPDFYYGELTRDRTRRLIAAAKRTTVQHALKRLADSHPKGPWLRDYVLDDSRADWSFFLEASGVVVDIGAGYGAISRALAPSVQTVISVDPTLERLQLLQLCARDAGLDNVHPLHANGLELPLSKGCADAVVVMGVLEWVGTQQTTSPVDVLQQRFLRQVAAILRPGGQLVLGIENRWGYNYLLGDRDEHTGLWGTNLLPRALVRPLGWHLMALCRAC